MAEPHSLREALIVGALADLEAVLARVEHLTDRSEDVVGSLGQARVDLDASAGRLIGAGNQFIENMNSGVQHEKTALAGYIAQTTQTLAAKAVDDQSKTLRNVAKDAFKGELDQRVAALNDSLKMAIERPRVPRLLELAVAGALGGVFTALAGGALLHFLHLLPVGR